jgi:hypothetical protein
MENISWTENVRNEVLVKKQRSILHEIANGKLIGVVIYCAETAFFDRLLQEE